MKEQKNSEVAAPRKFAITIPANFTIKRGTLVKFGIGFIIALALVPVLDWVIQTSITSQYVAFYKNSDVPRAAYIKELERQYGSQVANEMLAKAAISQAAKERDLEITDEDVTKAIDADKARAGITTDEAFKEALEGSGITEEDYRAYVRVTVTLDKLLEGTATEPTEKEISDYFTENAELYKGKKLDEVKSEISETIKQTNLTNLRQEWLTNALKDYNTDANTLITEESRSYKFLKSIELVKRLFSTDITK
jgi:hypothetical protein